MSDKIQIAFWRCEIHNALHFTADSTCWRNLKKAIEMVGFTIEEIEMQHPFMLEDNDWHKAHELLNAMFEIQGLKHLEGDNWLPALESLITEYAKLK